MEFSLEFEFKSPQDSYYWFPITVTVKDINEALEIKKRLETAICEHNELVSSNLRQEILGYSKVEYDISRFKKGKLKFLNIMNWEFRDIATVPEMNLSEHLKFIEENHPISERTIATLSEKRQFSVVKYQEGKFSMENEFLLLHVVN